MRFKNNDKLIRISVFIMIFLTVCSIGNLRAFAQEDTGSEELICISSDLIRACDTSGNVNTETALGNLTADAVRSVTGSDIALIPSGEFGLNIQKGNVTEKVIADCYLRNDGIAVAKITVSELLEILESSASQIYLKENLTIDWDKCPPDAYLQMSGISVRIDTAAPEGQKIMSAKLPDGTLLSADDENTVIKCAGTVSMFEGTYGHARIENYTETADLRNTVTEYFRSEGTIGIPSDSKRIELLGATEIITTNGRMIGFFIVVFGVIITFTARRIMKKEKKEETVGVPYGYKDSEEE